MEQFRLEKATVVQVATGVPKINGYWSFIIVFTRTMQAEAPIQSITAGNRLGLTERRQPTRQDGYLPLSTVRNYLSLF
jgi:hypothetical protein